MSEKKHLTSFRTARGTCTLAWTPEALVSLCLPAGWEVAPPRDATGPGQDDPALEEGLPDFVRNAIRRVQGHLRGQVPIYDDLPVNLDRLSPFTRQILVTIRRIPPGVTRTYGEVARAVGRPGAARAVGRAVAANPLPLVIPCHRVVAVSGRLGGFSAPGGIETKRWLLWLEGIARTRRP